MKITKRDVDDVYRLDFGSGTAPVFLSEEEMDKLRGGFQAERDETLGRWRDTENTDMVAYRTPEYDDDDGRCIRLLDETTGRTDHEWEQIDSPGTARRYFAAHPKPKPWEAAKHDEIWVFTIDGEDSLWRYDVARFVNVGGNLPQLGNPRDATAGHRVWPEGEDK